MTTTEVCQRLSPSDVEDVRGLIAAADAADGTPPLSDHVMMHLPDGGDNDVRHVLVRDGDVLVGYAHLDVSDLVEGSSGELVVLPAARRRGLGLALCQALLEHTPDGRLRLWAHGEHPAAATMAAAGGFTATRVLWQMRRPLSDPLPEYQLPAGITVRPFVVGQDEQAWTAVNNRAFAEHPDQSNWSVRDVIVREREPWFDPLGFFLAERDGDLVGFHWTKVHGQHQHDGETPEHPHPHPHPLIGEVYIVGVDPSEQGKGLGPTLTLVGLHHLQEQGLTDALLYVDETNTNAIAIYTRLGFTRHSTDVCYSRGF